MTATGTGFTFHFPPEFDDRAEHEMELKGHLNGGQVELADGRRFPIFFFDPVRLSQESESAAEYGDPVIAEPGMVVIPDVTRVNILRAIERLIATRFFNHLKPIAESVRNGVAVR
jgi:hypothetical protein